MLTSDVHAILKMSKQPLEVSNGYADRGPKFAKMGAALDDPVLYQATLYIYMGAALDDPVLYQATLAQSRVRSTHDYMLI